MQRQASLASHRILHEEEVSEVKVVQAPAMTFCKPQSHALIQVECILRAWSGRGAWQHQLTNQYDVQIWSNCQRVNHLPKRAAEDAVSCVTAEQLREDPLRQGLAHPRVHAWNLAAGHVRGGVGGVAVSGPTLLPGGHCLLDCTEHKLAVLHGPNLGGSLEKAKVSHLIKCWGPLADAVKHPVAGSSPGASL